MRDLQRSRRLDQELRLHARAQGGGRARDAAYAHIREHQQRGEVVTGLLYISPDSKDVHDQNDTVPGSLYNLPHAQLCPGNDALQKLMGQFRQELVETTLQGCLWIAGC